MDYSPLGSSVQAEDMFNALAFLLFEQWYPLGSYYGLSILCMVSWLLKNYITHNKQTNHW